VFLTRAFPSCFDTIAVPRDPFATAQAPGGKKVEAGNHYVSFISNILLYLLNRL
jgi:hypothetical protein